MSLVENNAEDDFEELEDLDEMMTYYPTEEEFVDPIKYIENLHYNKDVGTLYGCVKIVPPASFKP